MWKMLGMARDAAFWLRIADPVKRVIVNAAMDVK
jgi:hypothetical protein